MSELWRNKNVARFLSETRLWDYRQSRSILHAIHPLQTNEPLGLGHGTNQVRKLLFEVFQQMDWFWHIVCNMLFVLNDMCIEHI